MKGIRNPETMIPNPLPAMTAPVAVPRMSGPNQRATSAIIKIFAAPEPTPVRL